MDSPSSAHPNIMIADHCTSRGSSSSITDGCPQQYGICICGAPPDKAYLSPLIGCANKCRPRWFHLRCVGLTQYPYDGAPWYCPSCRVDQGVIPSICVCDDAPYAFGPMLECAKQDDCATRWFHLPCVDTDRLHAEGEVWYCKPCAKDIAARREREEEVQRQRDAEMMESFVDPAVLELEVSMDHQDVSSHDMLEVKEQVAPQEHDSQAAVDSEPPVVETVEIAQFEIPTPSGKSQTPEPQTQPEQAKVGLTGVHTPPASRDPTEQPASFSGDPQAFIAVPQASEEHLHTTNDETTSGPSSEEVNNNGEFTTTQEESTNNLCIPNCTGDDQGPMIACDDANCPRQWYHYTCVNVTSKPRSGKTWYCPTCLPQHPSSPNSGRKPRPSRASRAPTATPSHQTQPQKVAGQKRTRRNADLEYCMCGTPASDDMIACDGNCSRQWFHFACVGLTAKTVPKGAWYCEDCVVEEERKKKNNSKRRRR